MLPLQAFPIPVPGDVFIIFFTLVSFLFAELHYNPWVYLGPEIVVSCMILSHYALVIWKTRGSMTYAHLPNADTSF